MKKRKYRYFVGDFETTVYAGQTDTEVWAAATVELNTESVTVSHSIGDCLKHLASYKCNVICYFHNLKFDGSFWIDYLIKQGYQQAFVVNPSESYSVSWLKEKDMSFRSFKYSISDKGQWYSITIRLGNGKFIELRDSLKLLPFSVKTIGESFKLKHRKLEMEYKGLRYAGCEITAEEIEYIKNDVLVIKEAIEFMFAEGHNKLTIGSCCMEEYKNIFEHETVYEWDKMFPNLYDFKIDKSIYGVSNAGEYVKKSYKGGWCYAVKGKTGIPYGDGVTADVNSLYPSMMHSESGNYYPIGFPVFFQKTIPDVAREKYFFVRIRTRFYLKKDKLPFIQIKGSPLYRGTEALETSDVYLNGQYHRYIYDGNMNKVPTTVELTLTMTDYKLFLEHYDVEDFEILDGCYFEKKNGLFDAYIDKYKEIKMNSKGAMRQLAKLFLNNLYGKFASSTDSSFKVAYLKDDNSIGFRSVEAHDKQPGYIPIGSAITSYARNFTIRAAQANYHGVDKAGFIYADTDSIHCNLKPEEVQGIKVHNTAFCCWKLESKWDKAIFTRQKTYIEHVVEEDLELKDNEWTGEKVEHYYNVKCAGMPSKCKDLFIRSMEDKQGKPDDWREEEKDFLFDETDKPIHRDLTDFTYGLTVPGKLMPKRIPGGVLLCETTYKMR